MLAQNSVTDAQPQSSSLAYFLSGEEGIKNALAMNDSLPVICEHNLVRISTLPGRNFNATRATLVAHRVIGVVQNVQNHLLQLVRVAGNLWQIGLQLLDD